MSGAIPLPPNTPSWRGAQLRHRDNFTFFLPFTIILRSKNISHLGILEISTDTVALISYSLDENTVSMAKTDFTLN